MNDTVYMVTIKRKLNYYPTYQAYQRLEDALKNIDHDMQETLQKISAIGQAPYTQEKKNGYDIYAHVRGRLEHQVTYRVFEMDPKTHKTTEINIKKQG